MGMAEFCGLFSGSGLFLVFFLMLAIKKRNLRRYPAVAVGFLASGLAQVLVGVFGLLYCIVR